MTDKCVIISLKCDVWYFPQIHMWRQVHTHTCTVKVKFKKKNMVSVYQFILTTGEEWHRHVAQQWRHAHVGLLCFEHYKIYNIKYRNYFQRDAKKKKKKTQKTWFSYQRWVVCLVFGLFFIFWLIWVVYQSILLCCVMTAHTLARTHTHTPTHTESVHLWAWVPSSVHSTHRHVHDKFHKTLRKANHTTRYMANYRIQYMLLSISRSWAVKHFALTLFLMSNSTPFSYIPAYERNFMTIVNGRIMDNCISACSAEIKANLTEIDTTHPFVVSHISTPDRAHTQTHPLSRFKTPPNPHTQPSTPPPSSRCKTPPYN